MHRTGGVGDHEARHGVDRVALVDVAPGLERHDVDRDLVAAHHLRLGDDVGARVAALRREHRDQPGRRRLAEVGAVELGRDLDGAAGSAGRTRRRRLTIAATPAARATIATAITHTDHRVSSTSPRAGAVRGAVTRLRSAAAVDQRRARRAGHTATRLAITHDACNHGGDGRRREGGVIDRADVVGQRLEDKTAGDEPQRDPDQCGHERDQRGLPVDGPPNAVAARRRARAGWRGRGAAPATTTATSA